MRRSSRAPLSDVGLGQGLAESVDTSETWDNPRGKAPCGSNCGAVCRAASFLTCSCARRLVSTWCWSTPNSDDNVWSKLSSDCFSVTIRLFIWADGSWVDVTASCGRSRSEAWSWSLVGWTGSCLSCKLWIKWQREPYGQNPVVWKVRQRSVLYFGWRETVLSSAAPWANWHLSPYRHVPFSSYVRHSSVLYLSHLTGSLLPFNADGVEVPADDDTIDEEQWILSAATALSLLCGCAVAVLTTEKMLLSSAFCSAAISATCWLPFVDTAAARPLSQLVKNDIYQHNKHKYE